MASDLDLHSGRAAWRLAWSRPAFRWDLALTVVLLVVATSAQARFVTWNEGRSGVVLPDPFLELFEARDLSTLTFGLIYAAILAAAVSLGRHPRRLLRVFQGYAYLALTRIVLMYLMPLDPPETIIPLRDPLVELFSTGADPLTRDLFFSGHTATLFLLYLVQPGGRLRGALLAATVVVASLTVWQHTHYLVDVLVAPFLAYGCFQLAGVGRAPLGTAPQPPAESYAPRN
ncbi:MAG: phosphatase PAP2-related protein [Planctomycetota bacterium]|nr:phosphatase PAP2-related protein [Planctomycetota bacterium]